VQRSASVQPTSSASGLDAICNVFTARQHPDSIGGRPFYFNSYGDCHARRSCGNGNASSPYENIHANPDFIGADLDCSSAYRCASRRDAQRLAYLAAANGDA